MTNEGNEEIDETQVVEEQPVIVLEAHESYGDLNEELPIFVEDLKSAKVGDGWATRAVSSTRAAYDEEAEVVYRNNNGVAVLITTRHWADNPSGDMDVRRKLVWVSFGKEVNENDK